MTHPPTQTEIRSILAAAGLRPQKRHGQHFLVDGNLIRLLVEEADLRPADTVLEVGAGLGNLTQLLVERAGWVVAVEIDAAIAGLARRRLADAANLDLLVTDVLADKHHIAPAVLDALTKRRRAYGGPWKLVANLPYAAATPLLAELVHDDEPPERLIFTVQEEVAARLIARPATPAYGPLGIIVQALADVKILRRLGPGVFWPPPRIASCMVRIQPSAELRRRITDLVTFRRSVEGLFRHRRKRAARSLALADPAPVRARTGAGASPKVWAARLKAVGLDSGARGETYSVDEIIRLANSLTDETA